MGKKSQVKIEIRWHRKTLGSVFFSYNIMCERHRCSTVYFEGIGAFEMAQNRTKIFKRKDNELDFKWIQSKIEIILFGEALSIRKNLLILKYLWMSFSIWIHIDFVFLSLFERISFHVIVLFQAQSIWCCQEM